jgi:PAS domain S-box-containing protein
MSTSQPRASRQQLLEELEQLYSENNALRASEIKYHSFFDNSLEGFGIIKGDRFIEVNYSLYSSFGLDSPDPLYKKSLFTFLTPASKKYTRKIFNAIVQKKPFDQQFEIEVYHRSGIIHIFEIKVHSLQIENEQYTISSFRDTTERKKMEHRLQESEEKYRNAVERANDAIAIVQNGNFVYANTKTLQLSGYQLEEFLNTPIFQYFHPDNVSKMREYYERRGEFYERVAREELKRSLFETAFICKDGSVLYAEVSVSLITYQGEPADLVIIRDITDRKKIEEEKAKLESQLIQAQKMESLGRLAGGIAHDFGNILTVIMGFSDLLKLRFPDKETDEGKAIESILRNARRSKALVNQLLGFARRGQYNPELLNINQLIIDTIAVSEKIFEKQITLKYEFDECVKTIYGDRNQLDQIFTNLSINAKDAMPNGGDLIFKTKNVYLDEAYLRRDPELKPGNYVKISVSDTGIGMTKEVKEKIFEPFFTTKPVGRGTGLGLSTVYGIVKKHNGHITFYSEPGKGTTFILYFPAYEKEAAEVVEKKVITKGSGTVLVVDDEEDVRDLVASQLTSLGYTPLLARDGKEALSLYRAHRKKIAVILLDMIMPVMSGKETYKELKRINPSVKILIISGYSQKSEDLDVLDTGALGFLQKPFELYELSKMLNKAIKQKGASQ